MLVTAGVTTPTPDLTPTPEPQAYNFYFSDQPDEWRAIAENVDGRILSTLVAGGFVGAYIAMYASSNGGPSTNHVDFDWFEYMGLDES